MGEMKVNRLLTITGTVVVGLTTILGLCGTSMAETSNRTSSETSVSIPKGWKTYTYHKATISVPVSWVVEHNKNCPDSSAGVLLLGFPRVLANCQEIPASASIVSIVSIPKSQESGILKSMGGPMIVNDLHVYSDFGCPATGTWYAPSIGVEISASGPYSNRILHTIRKA